MNQVSRKISFNWRRNDGKDIPNDHLATLDCKAMERIKDLIECGYVEGELLCYINEFNYTGYWMISNG